MTLAGGELTVKAAEALRQARELAAIRDVQVQQEAFRLGELSHQDVGGKLLSDTNEQHAGEALRTTLNERFDADFHSGLGEMKAHEADKADAGDQPTGQQSPDVVSDARLQERELQTAPAEERSALAVEYLADLRDRAKGPFDVPKDVAEWKRIPSEDIAKGRLEWNAKRSELIKEWEKNNEMQWPKYESDVNDEKTGTKIRIAGDRHDAHHIQPLEYGGQNTSENITPMHANDHYDHRGIHSPDSPLSKLGRLMEG